MGKKQPRRPKHVPQRTCIVCREKFDKRRLTRIVRTPDEGVVVDFTGKQNGRGAYLCDQVSCWDSALEKTQLLNQALMTEMTGPERVEIATHKPTYDEVTE
jgi:predicted RNA-binding protein YlxR (DUF448 family)